MIFFEEPPQHDGKRTPIGFSQVFQEQPIQTFRFKERNGKSF